MYDEYKEFHDRVVELFYLVCKEFKIDKLVDWIDNILRKLEG
jgi:hypothetical protein